MIGLDQASAAFVVMEQLNDTQWHAVEPRGRATGVNGWVQVLSDALWMAEARKLGVMSIGLRGDRCVLSWPCGPLPSAGGAA